MSMVKRRPGTAVLRRSAFRSSERVESSEPPSGAAGGSKLTGRVSFGVAGRRGDIGSDRLKTGTLGLEARVSASSRARAL